MSIESPIRSCKQLVSCMALLSACALFSACSGPAAKKPVAGEQAVVSGSVMNDGKAITVDSVISFECAEKSAFATGKIDALGKFSLKAGDATVGIPAGRYRVMVRGPEAATVPVGSDAYKNMMSAPAQLAKPESTAPDIPTKFTAYDTSNISLELKPGADNKIDLDLAKLK